MLKLRNKLREYQEIYYLIFILSMTGMTSMGINSGDRIYLIVFAVATLFLLLKMAVTNFTLREILIMAVFTALLGINFLRNGEKTLILTAMGIFGAKDVDLQKVFKYAFWEKAVLTVGTLTLVAMGAIENMALVLPKNFEHYTVYCYGYNHPNAAFANIFIVLLLGIIVYGDKLKWYAYAVGTVIMVAAYEVFMCRTGLVVWCVLCVMILGYRVMRHFKCEKIYMRLLIVIPELLGVLTMVLPYVALYDADLNNWFNKIFTGRFALINRVYSQVWNLPFGHVPQQSFDSIYFHLLYNYGWILLTLCFIAYVKGMCYCNKKGHFYGTIALAVMSVYGYMELMPLSVLWNLPFLYLAGGLFKEKK